MWWIRPILTVCPVYSHTQTVLSEISLLIFLFLSPNNPRFIWLRNKCVLLTNRDKLCCYQLPQIWKLKCNYCMIYLHLFIFRKSWSVFRQVVSDVIRQVHNDKKTQKDRWYVAEWQYLHQGAPYWKHKILPVKRYKYKSGYQLTFCDRWSCPLVLTRW